jgi:pimeloyl-ACP methyl ester carboxylesterase
MRLHVHEWGSGPEVVLVHGVLLGGREAWREQRELTARWTLRAPDRPGHGKSPDARQDFEPESALIADQLLDRPVHLVGVSYGAIVAMLAAVRRPDNVRSLTVVEPPAMRVARGNPVIDAWDVRLAGFLADPGDDDQQLLGTFFPLAGVPMAVPDPVPAPLVRGAAALRGARHPGEAVLPLAELAAAGIPMLVITGDHMPEYEIIGDTIAEATGAERAKVPGMGHLVPDMGPPFNARLEAFLLTSGN